MPGPSAILLSLPTKNIDYPAASLPVLAAAMRDKGLQVEVRDINLEVKDELMTVRGLDETHREVLPFLMRSTLSDSRTYGRLQNLQHLLEFICQGVGFDEVARTKRMLQERRYVELFTDTVPSQVVLLVFALARAMHTFVEIVLDQASVLARAGLSNVTVQLLERAVADVCCKNPAMVGLTVLDIQRKSVLWFGRRLRPQFDGKIVLGGADPTMHPEAYARNFPWIDAVFIGQSDDTVPMYAEALMHGRENPSHVPDVIHRDGDGGLVRTTGVRQQVTIRRPDFDGLPLSKYLLPTLPITSSRGCYWAKCEFCVHHRTYGGYSERPVEDVVEDIRVLGDKYRTRFFHFTDDTLKVERAVAIATRLLSEGISARFLTYLRFERDIRTSDLETMYAGGFRILEFGLESASQKVLASMKKGTSVPIADRILRAASRAGLLTKLMAFYDYPGETADDLEATLRFFEQHVAESSTRPFFPIRNRLELRTGSTLLARALREPLFAKVWLPSGELASNALYCSTGRDYHRKKVLLTRFLDRMRDLMRERGVYDTDDENLTLDLILMELQENGYQTTLKWI